MDSSRKSSCRNDAESCQSMDVCSFCQKRFVGSTKSSSVSKDYAISASKVSARQKPRAQSAQQRRKIPYEPPSHTESVTSCKSFNSCDKCRKFGEVENSARLESASKSQTSLNTKLRRSKSVHSIKFSKPSTETISENDIEVCKSFDACSGCAAATRQKSKTSLGSSKSKKDLSRVPSAASYRSNNDSKGAGKSDCNSFDVCNACAIAIKEKNQPTAPSYVSSIASPPQTGAVPKKKDECPPNPCESLEQSETAVEKNKRSKMRKSSAGKTKLPDTSRDLKSTTDPGVKDNLSKKYHRMKYEIEFQNFFIDKLNRELKTKTLKCLPERELCQLKTRLDREVSKLRDMVQYAMCLQRQNRGDKWGAIPVSTVNDEQKKRSQSCPQEASKKLQPPVIPSDFSNITGFSELENIKMSDGKEDAGMEKELKEKEMIIQDLREQLESTNCQLQKIKVARKKTQEAVKCHEASRNGEITCEELFKPSKPCTDDIESNLKTAGGMIAQLMTNLEEVKCEVAKLCGELNEIRNRN